MTATIPLRALRDDPAAFRRHLLVDTDNGPRLLDDVVDPWQRDDFTALDAGWRRAACLTDQPGCNRAWLERPRGHSKTSDIAVMATWCLAFARRPVRGIAAAADKDQAGLLRSAVASLVRLNPWLGDTLDVQASRVVNTRTDSTLTILSSDVSTSFGRLPDFVVADELCHWRNAELWESLFSSSAKREGCLLLIISNAGFQDSWQWPLREAIRDDASWYFSRLDGPVASWITSDRLAEQERLLPRSAFQRLWLNQWVSGAGDALDGDLIDLSVNQAGPMLSAEDGYGFVAGLDLGVKRDHSALVVLGCHFPTGRVRVAMVRHWQPTGPRNEVDLQSVQDAVLEARDRFHLTKVVFDPWQCELMAQQLRRHGVHCEPQYFLGRHLNTMATSLLGAFASQSLDLYPCSRLIRDLKRLTIVEKSYGFRLESTRDSGGHADTAIALSMALPHATRRALSSASMSDCHPYRFDVNNRPGVDFGVQIQKHDGDHVRGTQLQPTFAMSRLSLIER